LLNEFIENGKPIEKSSELKRLFKVLKIENNRLKQVSYSDDPKYYFTNCGRGYNALYEFCGMFINNNFLFKKIDRKNLFVSLHEYYNIIENVHSSNMLVFKQPNRNNLSKLYVERGLAININSKHKNEAFEFVKFMLSEDVQSKKLRMRYLPVNNKSYEYHKKNFKAGYHIFESDLLETQMSENMVEEVIKNIESAEICEYIGNFRYVYRNIMNESIEDYYNDRLTFDEMIDEINNKLSIYYSE
jgi:ABC-type glycerol-3-phosphate transport system substrate-binding protein